VTVLWRLFSVYAAAGPAGIAGVAFAARRWPDNGWLSEMGAWLGMGDALGVRSLWFWAVAVAAAAVVLTSGAWKLFRYGETLVHEIGHACVAGLLGSAPARITLEGDHSGLTQWRGRRSRLRSSVATFSGYPWPVVVGCSALLCAGLGAPRAWVVWAAGLAAVTSVGLARNALAVVVAFLSAAMLGAAAWSAPTAAALLSVLLGFLLVASGLSSVVTLVRLPDLAGSDAGRLQQLVCVPARVVAALMLGVAGGVVAGTAWALVAAGP
jgi:hypothetical protein